MEHPNDDVQQALVRLSDALCTWERSTGIESVLILRESRGFVYRAMSGKPNVPDDIEDADLVQIISGV
jgi:hypothetical protein